MQRPSFESLISPPWAEEENVPCDDPYHHLSNKQPHPAQSENSEESLESVVILGYN